MCVFKDVELDIYFENLFLAIDVQAGGKSKPVSIHKVLFITSTVP